jgi:hypothetical protein
VKGNRPSCKVARLKEKENLLSGGSVYIERKATHPIYLGTYDKRPTMI